MPRGAERAFPPSPHLRPRCPSVRHRLGLKMHRVPTAVAANARHPARHPGCWCGARGGAWLCGRACVGAARSGSCPVNAHCSACPSDHCPRCCDQRGSCVPAWPPAPPHIPARTARRNSAHTSHHASPDASPGASPDASPDASPGRAAAHHPRVRYRCGGCCCGSERTGRPARPHARAHRLCCAGLALRATPGGAAASAAGTCNTGGCRDGCRGGCSGGPV